MPCCVDVHRLRLILEEPVVERALELLPHDLMVGRYRRLMRVAWPQAAPKEII